MFSCTCSCALTDACECACECACVCVCVILLVCLRSSVCLSLVNKILFNRGMPISYPSNETVPLRSGDLFNSLFSPIFLENYIAGVVYSFVKLTFFYISI